MSSQNVRSLLSAELSTRRITHPHASYTKPNLLSCTACHLIIKSEALWEGHLRSANHRKNVQRLQEGQRENGDGDVMKAGGKKRKADYVDADEGDDDWRENGPTNGAGGRKRKAEEDVDEDESGEGRKKTKSDLPLPSPPPAAPPPSRRALNGFIPASESDTQSNAAAEATTLRHVQPAEHHASTTNDHTPPSHSPREAAVPSAPAPENPRPGSTAQTAPINEDEWAAFEREVLPLTTATTTASAPLPRPPQSSSANASSITISALPISASELAAQKTAEERQAKGRSREEEAEAEREEEGRRLADEFELQEEMERRVKRLKEKREMLRKTTAVPVGGEPEAGGIDGGGGVAAPLLPGGDVQVGNGDVGGGKNGLDEAGAGEDRGLVTDGEDDTDETSDEFDGW